MNIDAATLALIENLKLLNSSLDKIVSRIEILENDYKERYLKKKIFRWLIAFYPAILVALIFVIDIDHKKIAEIAGDINELINDTKAVVSIAGSYPYPD